jgi:inorganic pyrophosphatase
MARVIPLTVHFSEDEEAFLIHMGEQSFHGKTTVAYIGALKYMKENGLDEFIEARESNIRNKQNR